jgi:hypothetical protein
LPSPARPTLTEVPSAHTLLTLDPDGVVEVLEQIEVRADEPTAATWQITMQRGELFADPSLFVNDRRYRPGDGERPGTFRISRGTRGIRFDWQQPAGLGSARLGYRLALLGTAYTDVVDLPAPIWEREWPAPVRRLTAVLKLRRAARGRVIAWVEPERLSAMLAKTRHDVRLRTRDVPARAGVTLRAVLPRNVLTSLRAVNVKNKPGLAEILDRRNGNDRPWWPWAVAAALMLAVSAVVLRTALWRRPRPR